MSDERPSEASQMQAKEHFRRNFSALAFSAITRRVGWIFKTESIVMPVFVDNIRPDSGALRGLLPLISRFGRSFPQFVAAHWVNRLKRKWPAFFVVSLIMAIVWGVLAAVISSFSNSSPRLILIAFFLAYTIHWIANGAANLFEGVLQGKLVPAYRRGRLLAASNTIGCFLAIVAVYFLMGRWLARKGDGYSMIFGMTAALFAVSAFAVLLIKEYPDSPEIKGVTFRNFIADSVSIILEDKNFRRLIYVVSMFYAFHFLFPHYAVFGKEALGLGNRSMISFLIAQNTVNATGSMVMGYWADRKGNKIVLTTLIVACGCVPLLAIGIAALPLEIGRRWYWLVFACIGFSPVILRIIVNYVLEICPQERHGQYLGTLNLILALPTLAAPLVGRAIDIFSFRPVFIASSIVVFCGAVLSLTLKEPRNCSHEEPEEGSTR